MIAQDFITTNHMGRVYLVNYNGNQGTAFLINYDSSNYIITAKHLFSGIESGSKISLPTIQDSVWKNFQGNIYFHTNPNVDIAVLKLEGPKEVVWGISMKKDIQFVLSDRGLFLGFPFGMKTTDKTNMNDGLPVPLIKGAINSGLVIENGVLYNLLDGNNNPGFSGGPVLFKNRFNPADNEWYLMSVINAYRIQENRLDTPIGVLKYSENSSIIISIGFIHIIEIIESMK